MKIICRAAAAAALVAIVSILVFAVVVPVGIWLFHVVDELFGDLGRAALTLWVILTPAVAAAMIVNME